LIFSPELPSLNHPDENKQTKAEMETAHSLVSKAEKAYIQASLQANPPLRADGRGPLDFRAIALETGVSPLANGSARVRLGADSDATEVLAAVKLEVEDVGGTGDGVDGGRVNCSVTWYVRTPR
jgi:exosome complex component RRP42